MNDTVRNLPFFQKTVSTLGDITSAAVSGIAPSSNNRAVSTPYIAPQTPYQIQAAVQLQAQVTAAQIAPVQIAPVQIAPIAKSKEQIPVPVIVSATDPNSTSADSSKSSLKKHPAVITAVIIAAIIMVSAIGYGVYKLHQQS